MLFKIYNLDLLGIKTFHATPTKWHLAFGTSSGFISKLLMSTPFLLQGVSPLALSAQVEIMCMKCLLLNNVIFYFVVAGIIRSNRLRNRNNRQYWRCVFSASL